MAHATKIQSELTERPWQEFMLDGFVSKADGSDYTPAEARKLMEELFAFFEERGMGFGGGIGMPGMFDDEETNDG